MPLPSSYQTAPVTERSSLLVQNRLSTEQKEISSGLVREEIGQIARISSESIIRGSATWYEDALDTIKLGLPIFWSMLSWVGVSLSGSKVLYRRSSNYSEGPITVHLYQANKIFFFFINIKMKTTDTALLGHVGTDSLAAASLSDLWTMCTAVFIQGRILSGKKSVTTFYFFNFFSAGKNIAQSRLYCTLHWFPLLAHPKLHYCTILDSFMRRCCRGGQPSSCWNLFASILCGPEWFGSSSLSCMVLYRSSVESVWVRP